MHQGAGMQRSVEKPPGCVTSDPSAWLDELAGLLRQVSRSMVSSPELSTAEELRNACGDASTRLSRLRLLSELDSRRPPSVVCIGRTKAGKSTLRYVLTGEGAEGIGGGGQRTTRASLKYPWRGLDVVDTPGVGAYEGAADEAAALAAAAGGDLLLWVATPDSQQLAAVEPVLAAASTGQPLLVLLNHKRKFGADELSSVAEEIAFYDRAGHEARLRSLLKGTSHSDAEIVHANLWLAAAARQRGDDRLWDLSGAADLQRALRTAAVAAALARPRIYWDQVTSQVGLLHESLDAIDARLADTEADISAALKRLGEADERSRDSVQAAAASAVKLAVTELQQSVTHCLDRALAEEHRGRAETALNQEIAASCARVAVTVSTAFVRDATPVLRTLQADVGASEPEDSRGAVTVAPAPTVALLGDPLTARAASVGHTAVRVAVDGAMLITPVGWAAKLVGGVAVDRGLTAARNRLLPTLEEEQGKRRKSLAAARRQVDEWRQRHRRSLVQQLTQDAVDAISAVIRPSRTALLRRLEPVRDARGCIDRARKLLDTVATALGAEEDKVS